MEKKNVKVKVKTKVVKTVSKVDRSDNSDNSDNSDKIGTVSGVISKKIKQIDLNPKITVDEQEQSRNRLYNLKQEQQDQALKEQQEFEKILEKLRLEDEELERNKNFKHD